MVRDYKRKTTRGQASIEQYQAAAAAVSNGITIRAAAKEHGLCHVTLSRYLKKKGETGGTVACPQYSNHQKVFTAEDEQVLVQYLRDCSERHFGLTLTEASKLAYQCAVKSNINRPSSWDDNKKAGKDWMLNFRKRHNFSLRIAENTSLGRAIGFNRPAVDKFFDNLLDVCAKKQYAPQSIYNMDETGVTTVPHQGRVIAPKGTRTVGRVVSAEKGTTVTVVFSINAIGNSVPPLFIFPRKQYKDHFLFGAPPGSIGAANGSGWIKDEDFLSFLKHFAKHAKPSADNPVLLILDNHTTHLYIPGIDFCRENNITLLSLPPHCSHKLQPLDRVIYGPFKTYFTEKSHAWSRENPGKAMTIYNIPSLVSPALLRAATPEKIVESFRCTGIWPIDRNVFTDADFAPSMLTETPAPSTSPLAAPSTSTLAAPPTSILAAPSTSTLTAPSTSTLTAPSTSTLDVPSTSTLDVPFTSTLTAPSTSTLDVPSTSTLDVPSTSTLTVPSTSPLDAPSTSTRDAPSTSTSIQSQVSGPGINPYAISPIPHKSRESSVKQDRRRRKSEVLTSSPVKARLVEIKSTRKGASASQTSKKCIGGKGISKGKRKLKTIPRQVSSSEDEDYYCLVCMEAYSTSRPGEGWIECHVCKGWAHEECTDMGSKNFIFVCQNCDSDSD